MRVINPVDTHDTRWACAEQLFDQVFYYVNAAIYFLYKFKTCLKGVFLIAVASPAALASMSIDSLNASFRQKNFQVIERLNSKEPFADQLHSWIERSKTDPTKSPYRVIHAKVIKKLDPVKVSSFQASLFIHTTLIFQHMLITRSVHPVVPLITPLAKYQEHYQWE